MNTITIQVEDRNVMSGLIKVLKSMNGVVILPTHKNKKSCQQQAAEATTFPLPRYVRHCFHMRTEAASP